MDYYVQMQVDAFKQRCRKAGVQYEIRETDIGMVVVLRRFNHVQRYVDKKPAFSWIPPDPQNIPRKLNNFLDQFLAEHGGR